MNRREFLGVLVVTPQLLTREGEDEVSRPEVFARGVLTSADHELEEGTFELISYADGTPKPGASVRFPDQAVGPTVLKKYRGRRVRLFVTEDK